MNTTSASTKALLISTVLLVTWFVYAPGLSGAFAFDDRPNILNNEAIKITSLDADALRQATLSGTAGPLKRPISMLSFALNHYWGGLESRNFKIVNLLVHCINGVLIFVLTQLLLTAYRKTRGVHLSPAHTLFVSTAVMAAWLLHPINLTSVLYVVQRMNSLATLFILAGIIFYCIGRIRQIDGRRGYAWIIASLVLATPLAIMSKENGILLPIFLTVVEITAFRFRLEYAYRRKALIALHAIIIAVPALATAILLFGSTDLMLHGYQMRDFTLYERTLTQMRALWFYIIQTIIPMNSQLGIYHDDFVISRSLIEPKITALACASMLALAAISIYCIRHAPMLAFGFLFFIAGHGLESTILPLELVHEHRNYLPSFGLLLILVFYLSHPFKYLDTLRLRRFATIALIASFSLVTAARAQAWGDPLTHITMEADNHPNSPRANLEMGQLYMNLGIADEPNSSILFAAANAHFKRASALRPSFLGGLFAQMALASRRGQPVNGETHHELVNRLKTQPIPSNTIGWIDYFSKCKAKSECDINDQTMMTLVEAALSNDSLRGRRKGEFLTAASNYFFHSRDLESVIFLSSEAVRAQPDNPRFRMNLANILIITGRLGDAKDELTQVAIDDKHGIYSKEIARLNDLVDELSAVNSRVTSETRK